MNKINIIRMTVAILFSAFLVLVIILYHTSIPKYENNWLEIKNNNYKSIVSSSVLFSDIPVPDIKRFDIKIKYVKSLNDPNLYNLGYIAEIDMDSLDKAKLPPKYKKGYKFKIKGKEFITDSDLEAVFYEIKIDFELLDKDGFKLQYLSSRGNIESGKVNVLQATVNKLLSQELIKRTESIEPVLVIDK